MNDMQTKFRTHRETLVQDLSVLIADIQSLLQELAGEASASTAGAQTKLLARLHDLQRRLETAREQGRDRAEQWVSATDRYAHDHPWKCIGAVACLSAAAAAWVVLSTMRR